LCGTLFIEYGTFSLWCNKKGKNAPRVGKKWEIKMIGSMRKKML
jgi:hypothetical protein